MEKRVLLAITISLLIIITFQVMSPKVSPPPRPTAIAGSATVGRSSDATGPIVEAKRINVEEVESPFETDKYSVSFSNIGGSIKSVVLKDYKDDGMEDLLRLVELTEPSEYIGAISSIGADAPLDFADYERIHNPDGVSYRTKSGNIVVTKDYLFDNMLNTIELRVTVKNASSQDREFNYRIIGGSGFKGKNDQDERLIEVTSKVNEKQLGYKRPKDERIINPGVVSWSALKNKYFSVIIKPMVASKAQFYGMGKHGSPVMGVETETFTIRPGETVEQKYIIYIGPSDPEMLKKAGYGLEETINYGFFGGISKLLITLMKFMYKISHSWGIAIILLSVILNILLYPLTIKSLKSMKKMQELQPQMEKLKVQFKGSPEKLNKEIMELYKKYNINPLGGCLPMLLQMPIFIALYQALMKSIELRGASFLWIKDLSMPDAVKIPIELPIFGSSINILPIIMIVGMVVQQRISNKTTGAAVTDEQKQQQKVMLIVMPIMFGFIFYNMPSGLVLYWVVNTVLTIGEHAIILKQQ